MAPENELNLDTLASKKEDQDLHIVAGPTSSPFKQQQQSENQSASSNNKGTDIAEGIKETPRSWLMFTMSFTLYFLHGMNVFSLPVYYVTYMEYFQISKSKGAWINSIYSLCCFSVGVVSSSFVEHFGCRISTFVGGTILSTALGVCSCVPNVALVFILHGACAGLGAGTMFIGANVILTKYFEHYRPLASSMVVSGLGLAMFVAPILIRYLIDEYGWRGAILIHAAIVAHALPISLTLVEPRVICGPSEHHGNNQHKDKMQSTSSAHQEVTQHSAPCRKGLLSDILGLPMLTNHLFLLYCLSNILTRVNSKMLIAHLPNLCVTHGFTLEQGAFVASVAGGCSAASRFVAGLMSLYRHLNHTVVYGLVMLLSGLASLLFIYLKGLQAKCAAAAIFGLAYGFDYPFVPVILVHLMGVDRLGKSLGLYNMITMAPIITVMGPFAGFLYDVTQSYNAALYLGFCGATAGVLLSLLLAYLLWRKHTVSMTPFTEA